MVYAVELVLYVLYTLLLLYDMYTLHDLVYVCCMLLCVVLDVLYVLLV